MYGNVTGCGYASFKKNSSRGLATLRQLLLTTVGIVSVTSLNLPVAACADEVTDLRAQMKAMEQRLIKLEKEKKEKTVYVAAPSASAQAKVAGPAQPAPLPGFFNIPGTNTSMKIGGFVKLDGVNDIHGGNIGGTGTDFRAIPLQGTAASRRSGNFDWTARQTQINMATFTPTSVGDIRTYVAFDFYGQGGGNNFLTNSFVPRFREGYAALDSGDNNFLVGQTWSTFMDLISYPETLDINGPVGTSYIRQPMFRYTRNLGGGSKVYFAVEGAYSDFEGAINEVPGGGTVTPSPNQTTPYPDFVAKYTYDAPWGHFAIAGVGRYIELNTGGGRLNGADINVNPNGIIGTAANPLVPGKPNTFGGGFLAALSLKTFGKDSINAQFTGGSGIGRYLYGDADARPGASLVYCNAAHTSVCDLSAINQYGGTVAYQHYWLDNLRSTAAVGYVYFPASEFPDNLAASTKSLLSTHVNLIWSPAPRWDVGLEYIYGELQVRASPSPGVGTEGKASRLMGSVKVGF